MDESKTLSNLSEQSCTEDSPVPEKKSTRKRKATVLKDFIMNDQKISPPKPKHKAKVMVKPLKKPKRSIVTVAIDRLDAGDESEGDNEMRSEIMETEDCSLHSGGDQETNQNGDAIQNSNKLNNNGLCYKCSSCELTCIDLRDFLEHLIHHGYEKDQCPCCDFVEHSSTNLALHVLQHIRGIFRRINNGNVNETSDKSFHCNICETSVSQDIFFMHWQTHFTPIKIIKIKQEKQQENNKKEPTEWEVPIVPSEPPKLTGQTKRGKLNGQNKRLKVKTKQITKVNGVTKQATKKPTKLATKIKKAKLNGQGKVNGVTKKVAPNPLKGPTLAEKKKIEKRMSDVRLSLSTVKDATALSPEMLEAVTSAVQIDTQGRSSTKLSNCVVCKRAFGRSNDTKRHLIEHLITDALKLKEELQSLRCQICMENFTDTDSYKQHMRDHAMLPVFACQNCDRVFSDASNYRKHKKKHDFEDLICYLCDEKFDSRGKLMDHVKSHKKEAKIKCDKCNKVYYFIKAYRRHLRVHDSVDRFQCGICWGRFPSIKDKNSHMRSVHDKKKT